MVAYPLDNPFATFTSLAGVPLLAGRIYIGEPDQDPETNPKPVYWDAAETIPADQPLTTKGGYIYREDSPAIPYVDGAYSIRVRDRLGGEIFYEPDVSGFMVSLASAAGAGLIGFSQAEEYSPATVGNHLKRFICVTDAPYNAKGDGVTDDTGSFISAIADILADGGGTLWIPAGTYKLSSTISISNPIKIVGDGLASIIQTTSATADVIRITSTSNDPGVEIEGLFFKSSVTRTAGFYINSVSANGTKVRRCRFEGAYNCIGATGSPNFQGLVVEDNEIIGCLGSGVIISGANGTQGCVQFYIRKNKFTGAAIGSQTPIGVLVTSAGDLTICDNHFLFCSTGIAIVPATGNDIQMLKIYDNWIDSGSANGISVSPTGGTVRAVDISRNWIATFSLDGIVASGTGLIKALRILDNEMGGFGNIGINAASTIVSNLVIDGNMIGQCASHGISTVANLNGFVITGNSIGAVGEWLQNQGWDILVNAGTSDSYTISGNRLTVGVLGALSDGGTGTTKFVGSNLGVAAVVPTIASAANITLTPGRSLFFISGTTNITSITAATPDVGRIVTLIFTGILTFTDGSNLRLAGNFVTSNDDTITLGCEGTNWFEICRSVN